MIHGADGVMAYAAPRIRERLARDGDEFPVVARGVQRQLQDAISLVVLHLGVRQGCAQGEHRGAERPDLWRPEVDAVRHGLRLEVHPRRGPWRTACTSGR